MPPPPDWLPAIREELLGPAHAVRELGAMLLEDVIPHGPPGLIGDLQTIQAVATHMEDLVAELLDRLADTPADSPDMTRLRHDVLNQVIGYCDIWLEGGEEDAEAAGPFRPQLEQLRSVGLGLLTRLDALRSSGPTPPPGLIDSGTFPVLSQAPAADTPASRSVAPGRILVVDDNAYNREVLVRRLQRQGHTVAEAVNGREALEELAAEHYDLVLLDILMPEMDGLEALARLKADERLRHLPVIMISALADIDRVAHSLQGRSSSTSCCTSSCRTRRCASCARRARSTRDGTRKSRCCSPMSSGSHPIVTAIRRKMW
jgi:CheY-like chemotaxis protein